ncbi:MAG TPA: class I SAM-dependent methyltransferase [Variovorax sp.]|nr:class I SAM-dependent methyltransferase [Variovorax sp.]
MVANVVDDYGWASQEGPHSCAYLAPHLLGLLRGLPCHRILDIGSGNGVLCAYLSSAGYQAAGVECDPGGVRISRKTNPHIAFYNFGVQDDPSKLLAHEEPFDAVVSSEVIEHLFSPHLLPRYASRCLKPGGFLIVTTPYHGYLKNLALAVMNKWDKHHTVLWHGGHIKFWSRATLSQLLSENGFRVLRFSGVGRLPYLWKSMVLVAVKESRPA